MFIQSGILRWIMSIIIISIFSLTTFPIVDHSFARDREERERRSYRSRGQDRDASVRRRGKIVLKSPRVARRGHVVRKLPREYRRVWSKNEPYYYSRGVFYRPSPSGFLVVGAPIGAIVVSLPIGYRSLWVGDLRYHVYGGVFYRRVPSGYVVVEAPPSVVLEDDIPVLVQPSQAAVGEVSVTADVLNVRSGPGLRYPIIYQIHRGYILEVQGKTTGWLYVQLPDGEFGWVMNIYTVRLQSPGSG